MTPHPPIVGKIWLVYLPDTIFELILASHELFWFIFISSFQNLASCNWKLCIISKKHASYLPPRSLLLTVFIILCYLILLVIPLCSCKDECVFEWCWIAYQLINCSCAITFLLQSHWRIENWSIRFHIRSFHL